MNRNPDPNFAAKLDPEPKGFPFGMFDGLDAFVDSRAGENESVIAAAAGLATNAFPMFRPDVSAGKHAVAHSIGEHIAALSLIARHFQLNTRDCVRVYASETLKAAQAVEDAIKATPAVVEGATVQTKPVEPPNTAADSPHAGGRV